VRRGFVAANTVLVLACVSACRDSASTGPPEIRFGVDVRDRCGMAIAEPRYAAAALEDDGAQRRTLKFDDIGCLAMWETNASDVMIRRRWVHDRPTETWIDGSTATFVQVRELSTPMGSGIAAFKNAAAADTLDAEWGGEELSWDAILARAREGALQAVASTEHEAAR